MYRLAVFIIAIACSQAVVRPVQACRGRVENRIREVVSALTEASPDSTPPSAIPSAWVKEIIRDPNCFRADEGMLCSACINTGALIIGLVFPSDDSTPSDQIAYELGVVPGSGTPFGFPTDYQLFLPTGDAIEVNFAEPDFSLAVPIEFDLSITPVDLAGNKGPSSVLHIEDPGDPSSADSGDSDPPDGNSAASCATARVSGMNLRSSVLPLVLLPPLLFTAFRKIRATWPHS